MPQSILTADAGVKGAAATGGRNADQRFASEPKRATVAMFLRTTSLALDDRVMKEANLLAAAGESVMIYVLERENRRGSGTLSSGVAYRALSLWTRRLPRGRFVAVKTLELSLRFLVLASLSRARTLWVHNLELVALIALAPLIRRVFGTSHIVWDQHELPPDAVLRRRLPRRLFVKICGCADVVIAANAERATVLRRLRLVRPGASVVVPNYVGDAFARPTDAMLPSDYMNWRDGSLCLIAPGGAVPNRYFDVLLRAVAATGAQLVILGGNREKLRDSAHAIIGDDCESRVHFTGWVAQESIAGFLADADVAVILYSEETTNGRYCAPNRLHQALAVGIPSIVGRNLPMRRCVSGLEWVYVLDSDGRCQRDLEDAIRHFQLKPMGHTAPASTPRFTIRQVLDVIQENDV